MENSYSFNSYSINCSFAISDALYSLSNKDNTPTIVCIGSDLVLGDSLGPLIGTILKRKNVPAYIYGTLNSPITAKEIVYIKDLLKSVHKNSPVIAIDAAVGLLDDVGLIKVNNSGLMPGLGVNKDLGSIGDISIIGIVAEKSRNNYSLFNTTRLSLIYKMAEAISNGIFDYFSRIENLNKRCI